MRKLKYLIRSLSLIPAEDGLICLPHQLLFLPRIILHLAPYHKWARTLFLSFVFE